MKENIFPSEQILFVVLFHWLWLIPKFPPECVGSAIWWSQRHSGLAASVRKVFNELLLHKAAGAISKAAADLRKPLPFAAEMHFHQVPWEHAHWEKIKLYPSWEQLICSQGAQPAMHNSSRFGLSNPPGTCVPGIPLCTSEEKQHLSIAAFRAENNERLHNYRFCILALFLIGQ